MLKLAFSSPVYEEIKRKFYRILQKHLNFDIWHTNGTIYSREYAKWIVSNVNELLEDRKQEHVYVVELGCGLGEIIGNIHWRYKVGYDIDVGVIKAAKIVSNGKFLVGSFDDVELKEKKLEVLILANFIHGIPPIQLKSYLDDLCSRYDIRYIVIDTVKGGTYSYFHDGLFLFGDKYLLKKRSQRFAAANGAKRYEELWEKNISVWRK